MYIIILLTMLDWSAGYRTEGKSKLIVYSRHNTAQNARYFLMSHIFRFTYMQQCSPLICIGSRPIKYYVHMWSMHLCKAKIHGMLLDVARRYAINQIMHLFNMLKTKNAPQSSGEDAPQKIFRLKMHRPL